MKYVCAILCLSLLIACNQNDSAKKETTPTVDSNKSVSERTPPAQQQATAPKEDSMLLITLSEQILGSLKAKDFSKLASYVHPGYGLRFCPYAYVDTQHSQRLSPKQLANAGAQKRSLTWGSFDGKDSAIKMDIRKYFDRFVYDKDFLHAQERSVNRFLGGGNSLNNLKDVYPEANFTEFYFPGFDPKYDGMDWRTLRLVFKMENNKPWLIAIVHDEWTI